jgi:hypothetical protein
MTDATKLIAGLLLISEPEFQRSMFRAGHAHARVLVSR